MDPVEVSCHPPPRLGGHRAAAAPLQRGLAVVVVAAPIAGVVAAAAHAAAYGLTWWEPALLGVMYAVCLLGVSVGFHRHFAHGAFKAHPRLRSILGAMGSMASQGPLVFWVAQHRRQHAGGSCADDPHAPCGHADRWRGLARELWRAQLGGRFSDEAADWVHFARDTLRDRQIWRVHEQYWLWVALGLILPAAAGAWLAGSLSGAFAGFLWGGLVRMFAVNQASWCVGSVCRVFGDRPFETSAASANNFWVAVCTFGEGLQNNHHAFPHSAAYALRRLEPDLGLLAIRALERLELVWDVNAPSAREIAKARRRPLLC